MTRDITYEYRRLGVHLSSCATLELVPARESADHIVHWSHSAATPRVRDLLSPSPHPCNAIRGLLTENPVARV